MQKVVRGHYNRCLQTMQMRLILALVVTEGGGGSF